MKPPRLSDEPLLGGLVVADQAAAGELAAGQPGVPQLGPQEEGPRLDVVVPEQVHLHPVDLARQVLEAHLALAEHVDVREVTVRELHDHPELGDDQPRLAAEGPLDHQPDDQRSVLPREQLAEGGQQLRGLTDRVGGEQHGADDAGLQPGEEGVRVGPALVAHQHAGSVEGPGGHRDAQVAHPGDREQAVALRDDHAVELEAGGA